MKSVGALAPSSKFLVKKMLREVDFSKDITLLELGPGTGAITNQILEQLSPNSKLICLELNEQFCSDLKKNGSRQLEIVQGSAEEIEKHFKDHNFDYVVSGLPLAIFKKDAVKGILNSCAGVLNPKGKFIQFQYSLASKKTLQSVFSKVDVSLAALNLPPAVIYTCNL